MNIGFVVNIPRADIKKDAWDEYVSSHPDGWLWHTYTWLDYCLAYAGGKDLSFALTTQDGKLVGLVPLIAEGKRFSMGGNPTVQMLLTQGMQTCVEHIVRRITALANLSGVQVAETMCWLLSPLVNGFNASLVQEELVNPINQRNITFARRVVNLKDMYDLQWTKVRKSYKQFIRRGQKKYVLNGSMTQLDACHHFLAMHGDFYKQCRDKKTYVIQQDLCIKGFGRAYLAINDQGLCEGGIMWYVYKGIAYYASGVYPQDNVSQYLIWASMCELAAEGIQYADLGYQGRARNEKEKNIEFFKRGFGGIDWPVPCVETIFINNQDGAA